MSLPDEPGRAGAADPLADGAIAAALRDWIRARTGLHITEQNQAPVELAVRMEAERHGLDPLVYLQRLLSGALPPQAFIDAVTTNESYFFRALEQMRVLVNRLIPARIAAHPNVPVRILSLPCARGEEPYSIAILCEETRIPPPAVELVGADISATCIAEAARGRYGPLALRRTDPDLARRWFRPVGARGWQLEPALLGRVRLHRLNLLTDAEVVLGRSFDVVFCENLLIYFDAATTAAALGVLRRLLLPDGWLFVDHAEWSIPRVAFEMREIDGVMGFRPPGASDHGNSAGRPVGSPAGLPAGVEQRPAPSAPVVPDPTAVAHRPPRRRRGAPPPARQPPAARRPAVALQLRAAQAHYEAKRFAEALAGFDAVLESQPGHAAARLGKARVLADCGEDFEALELAESLLHAGVAGGPRPTAALAPVEQVEALALMGLLLHKKGLRDLARGYLLEVRRRAPTHPSLGLLGPLRPGD